MSGDAHDYQDRFEQLKNEFNQYERQMPQFVNEYGTSQGDWNHYTPEDFENLINICDEQIRIANEIVKERMDLESLNPDGDDDGHQEAVRQWQEKLDKLTESRRLMENAKNFKEGDRAARAQLEAEAETGED